MKHDKQKQRETAKQLRSELRRVGIKIRKPQAMQLAREGMLGDLARSLGVRVVTHAITVYTPTSSYKRRPIIFASVNGQRIEAGSALFGVR